MPVAVKRVAKPIFPVTFTLTLADSMAGGSFYDGDLTITARLDAAVRSAAIPPIIPKPARGSAPTSTAR